MSIINPTALPFSTVYSCTKRLGRTVCEHIRGKMAKQKGGNVYFRTLTINIFY